MHTLVCGKDQADAGFESGLVNLMLTSHNEAIKTLFHQSTSDLSNPHVLTTHFQSLFVYFCYAFILGLLTYGIAVPSGLFVPAIMSGASLGRLVGEFGQALLPESSFALSPGSWALVGAAAMLGVGAEALDEGLRFRQLEVVGGERHRVPRNVEQARVAAHRGGPVIPDDRRRWRRVVGPRSRLPNRVAVPLVLTSIEFRGERLVADGGAPLFIPRDEGLPHWQGGL